MQISTIGIDIAKNVFQVHGVDAAGKPVLKKQLEIYDQIVAKKSAENPLFKEIVESQLAFAERAVRWDMDNNVSRRMAYNHYFGQKPGAPKKA